LADEVRFDASKVQAFLMTEARILPQRAGAALYAETLIEQKESMRRTPVLTGAARASHETSLPDLSDSEGITCRISVGGPGLEYVVPLHFDLDAYHANGQALFLESTIEESRPYFAERVAARLGYRG